MKKKHTGEGLEINLSRNVSPPIPEAVFHVCVYCGTSSL